MSHNVIIEFRITSLTNLKEACAEVGFEFVEGQRTFKSYQAGICNHAIKIPGAEYEVGVMIKSDGTYGLAWDPYPIGGLINKVGHDAAVLKQGYRKIQIQHEARRMKKRIILEEKLEGNVIHVRLG